MRIIKGDAKILYKKKRKMTLILFKKKRLAAAYRNRTSINMDFGL